MTDALVFSDVGREQSAPQSRARSGWDVVERLLSMVDTLEVFVVPGQDAAAFQALVAGASRLVVHLSPPDRSHAEIATQLLVMTTLTSLTLRMPQPESHRPERTEFETAIAASRRGPAVRTAPNFVALPNDAQSRGAEHHRSRSGLVLAPTDQPEAAPR